ncbi:hypothetical protein T484DRAFT_1769496 [Baffinella frigidus]|nr:hypothetical protein T484DRAFT_1769496 [Cryptophyta sp. CCMP2293]
MRASAGPARLLPLSVLLLTLTLPALSGDDAPTWARIIGGADNVEIDPATNEPLSITWLASRAGVALELQLAGEDTGEEVALAGIRVGMIVDGELVGEPAPLQGWNAAGQILGGSALRGMREGTMAISLMLFSPDGAPVGRATDPSSLTETQECETKCVFMHIPDAAPSAECLDQADALMLTASQTPPKTAFKPPGQTPG